MLIFCEKQPIKNGTNWDLTGGSEGAYIYLTDEGRSQMSIGIERIESRQRMVNGRMRSYYVTDKKSFDTSWENLPSRTDVTSDGFSAGQDIKDWYDSNFSDFWILIVYDNSESGQVATNAELYNVFFENFSYDVVKRGGTYDMWNVSMSLVEV